VELKKKEKEKNWIGSLFGQGLQKEGKGAISVVWGNGKVKSRKNVSVSQGGRFEERRNGAKRAVSSFPVGAQKGRKKKNNNGGGEEREKEKRGMER